MWMDHRAIGEAFEITRSKVETTIFMVIWLNLWNPLKNAVLEQMGGNCSPEFSLAKLLWLSRNEKERFNEALAFMELPDWLAWRCSNLDPKDYPRSVCSVVCKWGYDAFNKRWRDDLFKLVGMDEFIKDKSRIGGNPIKNLLISWSQIGYIF